ncbi:hypothetical protein FOXG_08798 [Fusarium oxysporum f. sp. lycopersici 4287]|uniref:Uncharacterized protein n=2 Tax=Fusarium oxysporum TaxID=5507 RepID=A0A0J9WNQ9_FUSO4|nr:hypothetical protein FOXG_08798 [Fusarium oxysporum f. sp. lycopersici 4287]XP_018245758.1 hypothetical protein FOXG_08798 [Fusarium oxysporum f. sp. lycopersici 4287]XP_018245759.1 hypothetical protein FOXG_08798 [Fusarium oxysporum f. sp. lycopersici 4287]EXK27844.1 hypothetical protein FOMG_15693 [Fusarium oxysporum f. sp. melonis 26406]EXK27845.1 hypothetical protein FOMG_15693 [Fusarium oxysporum f. sp. melonis 26406]KNB07712.1 hypothetical protein FOXG_08798 [Fusarium oxysporum f. sp.
MALHCLTLSAHPRSVGSRKPQSDPLPSITSPLLVIEHYIMSQTTTSAKLRLICALKSVDNFFGGQDLGISSENVSMQLVDMRASDQESYIGFFIDFSFPTSGEDNGFVKCDLIEKSTRCCREPWPT